MSNETLKHMDVCTYHKNIVYNDNMYEYYKVAYDFDAYEYYKVAYDFDALSNKDNIYSDKCKSDVGCDSIMKEETIEFDEQKNSLKETIANNSITTTILLWGFLAVVVISVFLFTKNNKTSNANADESTTTDESIKLEASSDQSVNKTSAIITTICGVIGVICTVLIWRNKKSETKKSENQNECKSKSNKTTSIKSNIKLSKDDNNKDSNRISSRDSRSNYRESFTGMYDPSTNCKEYSEIPNGETPTSANRQCSTSNDSEGENINKYWKEVNRIKQLKQNAYNTLPNYNLLSDYNWLIEQNEKKAKDLDKYVDDKTKNLKLDKLEN